MNEIIEKILEAGAAAPSGDNLQPWEFTVSEREVVIHMTDAGADSVYDQVRSASLFAIGAVIENMVVAARYFKLDTTVSLFPDEHDTARVARLSFAEVEVSKEEEVYNTALYKAVFTRVTNRKPYQQNSVSPEARELFERVPSHLGLPATVVVRSEPEAVMRLAPVFANDSGIVLSQRPFHDSLYRYLVWSKARIMRERVGLYVKTLDLSSFNKIGVWLCRSWLFVRLGRLLGLVQIVVGIRRAAYRHTGAFCAITIPGNTDQDRVTGGRVAERVWLEATRLGLYMHPQYTYVTVAQLLADSEQKVFTGKTLRKMQSDLGTLQSTFSLERPEQVAMYFRIGAAEPPSATSPKRPLAWSLRK